MLFNSYAFIVFFVPIVFFIFRALAKFGRSSASIAWLALASFFFYSYWNPPFVLLLAFSVLANYTLGRAIRRSKAHSKSILVFGIAMNLILIGYFKYTNFIMGSFAAAAGTGWTDKDIFLPLGISFFTFQQIAYLVELYRGEIKDSSFVNYALFVSFFPQLIAGPIVRYTDIMPSFLSPNFLRVDYRNITMGLFLFSVGLSKKVLIADTLSPWVAQVFDSELLSGAELSCINAWIGAVAYTMQIYFDFSGYSDMALGLGKLFNIDLPVNFRSPYKSLSITEFWRRWHITLSSFLRDYLYIPLGGNRKGAAAQYRNLMITMTLGGLWHGASWTFVIWGMYHGLLLLLHKLIFGRGDRFKVHKAAAWLATFLSAVAGWVVFRAQTLSDALAVFRAMVPNDFSLVTSAAYKIQTLIASGFDPGTFYLLFRGYGYGTPLKRTVFLIACIAVCVIMPSSVELASFERPDDWKRVGLKTAFAAFVFVVTVSTLGAKPTEFLYFQF